MKDFTNKLIKYIVFSLCISDNNATIMSEDNLSYVRDYLIRLPALGQFNEIIYKYSSAVVLIYSISDKGKNDHYFYNIGVKPRTSEFDYKFGIISGVVISDDGVVVTLYDCVKHANRFIVSIDSEEKKGDVYGELNITKNDFEATLIKAIPELNLAFLKIVPGVNHANKRFSYLNIASDVVIFNGKKRHLLLNGGVVYGKCRGEFFVTERYPRLNKNFFTDYQLFCSRISSNVFDGVKQLAIYNPVSAESIIPELHGGAVITLDGKLIGLGVYSKNINTPISLAIPSSIIKRGMQLATPWLVKISENSDLGIDVEPLSEQQKKQLIQIVKHWPSILSSEMISIFPRLVNGFRFDDLIEAIENGYCGVSVDAITDGGLSASVGIQRGDIILSLNGVGITGTSCFYNLEAQNIGEQYVELKIIPLSRKLDANKNILDVSIYKNSDFTGENEKKSFLNKSSETAIGILDKIKLAIQKMKNK